MGRHGLMTKYFKKLAMMLIIVILMTQVSFAEIIIEIIGTNSNGVYTVNEENPLTASGSFALKGIKIS
jgi:hypothetical protein